MKEVENYMKFAPIYVFHSGMKKNSIKPKYVYRMRNFDVINSML